MASLPTADDVLSFWFDELDAKQHFVKDQKLDIEIKERFGALHDALAADETLLTGTDRGKFATIIVFDQFSRNMFRGDARSFAFDHRALALAKSLVSSGADLSFNEYERIFIYMPYMHAETIEDQDASVRLYEALGVADNLDYAHRHRDVIREFGRFPHRNAVLGRMSTDAEMAHIETPGTGF